MKNSFLLSLFTLVFLFAVLNSDAQCTNQVTHTSGTATVAGSSITVTTAGVTTSWMTYCPAVTSPYFIGYSPGPGSGSGSYTFTFAPAVSGVTLNFSGASNTAPSIEEIWLTVNGAHYAMAAPGAANGCDALAMLTAAGDLRGCLGCGVSGWSGTTITGFPISTLTVADVVIGGTPNGSLFSLYVCPVILPTEWLDFTANATPANEVVLDWTTSTEINNDYFTIERSADGVTWEPIGEKDAVGNSEIQQSYAFTDPAPRKGLNHYRIRQTSLDGSESASLTETIQMAGEEGIRISPNPARDFVQVEGIHEKQATVIFSNHLGQVLDVPMDMNQGRITFYTSHLARGVYFLQVSDEGHTAFQKIVLE